VVLLLLNYVNEIYLASIFCSLSANGYDPSLPLSHLNFNSIKNRKFWVIGKVELKTKLSLLLEIVALY
jgi:hypothetical protein